MGSPVFRQEDLANGIRVFHVTGYLDKAGGEAFYHACDASLTEGRSLLVLNFRDCPAVASPGLACLMEIMMRVVDDFQGNIVLAGLDEGKTKLFTIIGLLPTVRVGRTVDDAVKILREG